MVEAGRSSGALVRPGLRTVASLAALVGQPANAGFLDSRGMVLLRLGRYAEAVASYDAALRRDPDTTDSLYGRGLAERHLGLKEKSVVDIRAAVALNAQVSDTFSMYGL